MPETIWLALLRGMNLGHRRLTNDELVGAVRSCGCDAVDAYQASGNVILRDGRPADELAVALTGGLAEALGYPVPVFLRTADEVRTIAAREPFTSSGRAAGPSKPQVIFLHGTLASQVLDAVMSLVPAGDALVPAGRELHWVPASGVGDSTLDFRRLDQLTGGTTVRTFATVQRIAYRL